jgi:uncharacterized membrane protein
MTKNRLDRGTYIGLGLCFGAAFGVIFNNLAVGVALGVLVGSIAEIETVPKKDGKSEEPMDD